MDRLRLSALVKDVDKGGDIDVVIAAEAEQAINAIKADALDVSSAQRKEIAQLSTQVAEADAARRHAQAVSTKLVEDKRALEAELAEAKHSAWIHSEVVLLLHREKKEIQDALAQRMRDLEEVCQTESELREDIHRLNAFVDSLSSKFWSYEEKMCAEARAGLTQDQRTGAAIVLHWLKEQFSEPQNHSVDANKMVAPETILSVTEWANTTFGQATIRTQIARAEKEFVELLKLQEVDHDNAQLAEEAADVCICLYRVIGTLDPDAINKKMKKNRARKWQVDGNGTAQHVGE